MDRYHIAAFYVFAPLASPQEARERLLVAAEAEGLKGTTIVAGEGLNGTMAGARDGLERYLVAMRAVAGDAGWEVKWSEADHAPFKKLKVRIKAEIVTMGEPDISPGAAVGRYVEAADWNRLITANDVVVIDTRNTYESDIGRFAGAVVPQTESFREFPDWWRENAARFEGKRVAMYCTGGIRCEKSTSFLIGEGVEEVFHLKGGILKYLEEVPAEQSRWDGACFVFDERVGVGHGLQETEHVLCRACGRPVDGDGQGSELYVKGVQCPACVEEYTDEDRARFAARQAQYERGEIPDL